MKLNWAEDSLFTPIFQIEVRLWGMGYRKQIYEYLTGGNIYGK